MNAKQPSLAPNPIRNYLVNKWCNFQDVRQAHLLEIGCGTGNFASNINSIVKSYVGIDPLAESIMIAQKENSARNVRYMIARAEETPLKNHFFDIIFYNFSFHCVEDQQQALKEARRLLRPNGILSINELREDNENWRMPQLIKNTSKYDEQIHKEKIDKLRHAKATLLEQQIFDVVECIPLNFVPPNSCVIKLQYWLLTPKNRW